MNKDITGIRYDWNGMSSANYLIPDQSGQVVVKISNSTCTISDSTFVILRICDCLSYIPNAFSPNQDGLNDFFQLPSNCYLNNFSIRIYNRWGQQIFQSDDPQFRFDGSFRDTPLQEDTYFYLIVAIDAQSGDQISKQGIIHLVR